MPYGYIYLTTDLSTYKIYIGQHKSSSFDTRYKGSGKIIRRIKRKRPYDLFTKVIEWCSSKTELDEREKFWISTFSSQDPEIGYNLTPGGDGGNTWEGRHHTEESIQKMKGRIFSEECRKRISEAKKGHPRPKCKWITPTGEIMMMDTSNAKKHHPDWVKIND